MESIVSFQNEYYNFNYININYEIHQISILLELKRNELIKNIKKECVKFFEQNKLNIDVNNILPRWIMLNIKNKENETYLIDPLLPYNASDFTQLKKDIYYFLDKTLSEKKIDKIIKELNLTEKFNKAIEELRIFIKSDLYIRNINSFDVEVSMDPRKYYYYFSYKYTGPDEIYKNHNSQKFRLHKNVVEKMINSYILNNSMDDFHKKIVMDDFFKKLVMSIIIRYNTLESYNQQAAVLPSLYNFLKLNYHVNFELFASSINFFYSNYCSLFYDLEFYLGSKGSFNNINITKGFYVANPPFDEAIMNNMSTKFVKSLKESNDELTFFITIPVWDKPEFDGFKALDILKKSGYLKYIENIPKHRMKFFNYTENKYKNLVNTYIIILQNEKGIIKYPILKDIKHVLLNFFPKN
jgi:hypothetical protein